MQKTNIKNIFKTEIKGLQNNQAIGLLKDKSLYFINDFRRFINGATHQKEYNYISSSFNDFLEFNGIKTHKNGVGFKVIYAEN